MTALTTSAGSDGEYSSVPLLPYAPVHQDYHHVEIPSQLLWRSLPSMQPVLRAPVHTGRDREGGTQPVMEAQPDLGREATVTVHEQMSTGLLRGAA